MALNQRGHEPEIREFHPGFPRTLWASDMKPIKLDSWEHAQEVARVKGPLRETENAWKPQFLGGTSVINQISYAPPELIPLVEVEESEDSAIKLKKRKTVK